MAITRLTRMPLTASSTTIFSTPQIRPTSFLSSRRLTVLMEKRTRHGRCRKTLARTVSCSWRTIFSRTAILPTIATSAAAWSSATTLSERTPQYKLTELVQARKEEAAEPRKCTGILLRLAAARTLTVLLFWLTMRAARAFGGATLLPALQHFFVRTLFAPIAILMLRVPTPVAGDIAART